MTTPRDATVVCVLGMARTGSSLTTRVLNLLGVYLGPEESLVTARKANPEGFWEHRRLMRLNERILRRMGGTWREPPRLPDGWETSADLEEERDEARVLLARTFAGSRLFGWKDPRNSLTLPFWQWLIPGMRYVICLRNPLDVAASLEHRDGISTARSFELWLTYTAAALVHTSGSPRLLVSYESYFEDWRPQVDRLARFVSREPIAAEVVQEAIQGRHRHHRTPPEVVPSDARVPGEVRALYVLTQLLQDFPDANHGLVEAYARALRASIVEPPAWSELREQRQLERRVKELHAELEKLRSAVEH